MASDSIGPPQTVRRSGITSSFGGRIKPLEGRMQQECAPFIFGETTAIRHQDEIGLRSTMASSDANRPDLIPRSLAALDRPALASKELVKLSPPETQPRRDTASTR